MKPDKHGLGAAVSTLPRVLLGGDLYKVGYVVADRDEAARALEDEYGFESLAHSDIHFKALLPDGSHVETHVACAMTTGQDHLIEVMQPVSGAVELWADVLRGPGPLLRFHNIGLLTNDLDGVKAVAARHRLPLELSSESDGAWSFAYHRVPLLGHLLEHVQFFGAAGDELDRLRGLGQDLSA
jgi:hypothetical protein